MDQDERALHPLVEQVGVAAARAAAPSASPCRRSSAPRSSGSRARGPAAISATRRMTYSLRSNASRSPASSSEAATTSWRTTGADLAGGLADRVELHRDVAPADDALSLAPRPRRRGSARARPGAPRRPSAGSRRTRRRRRRRQLLGDRPPRKNSSGSCSSIPAPSPVSGSAPAAPRCSRFSSAVSARTSVSCDGIPFSRATNATPHESCSNAGSYSPIGAVGASSRICRDGREWRWASLWRPFVMEGPPPLLVC